MNRSRKGPTDWLPCFTYRWATQGFDFLQAIEPAFISALPEDDFLVKWPVFFSVSFSTNCATSKLGMWWIYFLLTVDLRVFLQNLQALMNECIGHVIGKPHSPVTGLYIGKMLLSDTNCWRLPYLEVRIYFSVYILLKVYHLGVMRTRSRHNSNEIILQSL